MVVFKRTTRLHKRTNGEVILMNGHDILKQLIIATASEYVEEHDLTQEHVILIDDFADSLLYNLDLLLEKGNK